MSLFDDIKHWIALQSQSYLIVCRSLGLSSVIAVAVYLYIRTKPDWQIGQPDDTSGVAGKSNKFGFIKVFWYISAKNN